MSIVTNSSPPHLVLSGEVDLSVAPILLEDGTKAAETVAPEQLEIDLGDVTFIDSSGLGALVAVRNAAKQMGANLVLVRVNPTVARFFELAGVRESFDIA